MRVPAIALTLLTAFALAPMVCLAGAPALSGEWEAMEARGAVVTLSGLDQEGIATLLAESQRLVIDTERGIAVAAVLPAQSPSLARYRIDRISDGASEARFLSEVAEVFPGFDAERSAGGAFLTKMPSARLAPPIQAAQSQARRRESSPEGTCLYEGFEELPVWWEDDGYWFHYEYDHENNRGDYFWLDEDCVANQGSWSVSGVLGGDYGENLHCGDTYDRYTDSWMKYAYFIDCAAGHASGNLRFAFQIQSEANYDTLGYYASVDDVNYYGYVYSGNFSSIWYQASQDLRSWYGIGNLTAHPSFALAFNFYADNLNQTGFGAYLDDITILVDTATVDNVKALTGPFRLKVFGSGFQPGAWVHIDGNPVPAMAYKTSGTVVAKGGAALKGMVPRGTPVCVQVINPNGSTTPCYSYTR